MTLDNQILSVAYVLYLFSWLNENESVEDLSDEELKSLKEKWKTYWIPSLNLNHSGDCTKQPWACTRCHMENFIEVAKRLID